MHAALAGTQFSMSPGPPWCETGECSVAGEASSTSEHGEHGDRKTELVCIGQEFDHAAAASALAELYEPRPQRQRQAGSNAGPGERSDGVPLRDREMDRDGSSR